MGLAMSAMRPSAAIVSAASMRARAPWGKLAKSFLAAFTHEMARVSLLIGRMMTYLSSPANATRGWAHGAPGALLDSPVPRYSRRRQSKRAGGVGWHA